ncbi:MAG: YgjV family protein [Candidatus Krumholzibacteriia bacterium]
MSRRSPICFRCADRPDTLLRTGMNWIETIGYLGSVLVALSLAMSDVFRLRVLNLVGAAVFTAYGVLVGAYPVAGLNAFIVVVNVVYLWRLTHHREFFEVLDVTGAPSPFLTRFLAHHAREIAEVAPGFDLARLPSASVLFVLRNLDPAGLVVWTDQGEGIARIDLDYAVPRYRDRRCGRWFFRERADWFARRGFVRFEAQTPSPRHGRYLAAIGFRPLAERGAGWYQRPITSSRPDRGSAS